MSKQTGTVQWIGLRPSSKQAMRPVEHASAVAGIGLLGDRYNSASGKRGITLIQAEHLPVIAALCGKSVITADQCRRNIVVSGFPLLSLIGKPFWLGGIALIGTDVCEPCSKMESALGPGGYAAMLGHGGICARVVEPGNVSVGDFLSVENA